MLIKPVNLTVFLELKQSCLLIFPFREALAKAPDNKQEEIILSLQESFSARLADSKQMKTQ